MRVRERADPGPRALDSVGPGSAGLQRGLEIRGQETPLGAAQLAQADVGRDAVQPGREATLPVEALEGTPGTERGVLVGVLGVLEGAEHPVAMRLELGTMD